MDDSSEMQVIVSDSENSVPSFLMACPIEMEAVIVSLCESFNAKTYDVVVELLLSNPDVLQHGEKPSLLLAADEKGINTVRTILAERNENRADAISNRLESWLQLRRVIGFPEDGWMGPPPREERVGMWIAKRFRPYLEFLKELKDKIVPENVLLGRAICKSFRELRYFGIDLPEVLRNHYTTRLLPSLVVDPLWKLAYRAGRPQLAEAILESMGETDLQPGDHNPEVFFHNDHSYSRRAVERMIGLGMFKGLCISHFFHWSTNTTPEWRLWALQLLLECGSTAMDQEAEYPLLMPQSVWSRNVPVLKRTTALLRQYGWTPTAAILYDYSKYSEAFAVVSCIQTS